MPGSSPKIQLSIQIPSGENTNDIKPMPSELLQPLIGFAPVTPLPEEDEEVHVDWEDELRNKIVRAIEKEFLNRKSNDVTLLIANWKEQDASEAVQSLREFSVYPYHVEFKEAQEELEVLEKFCQSYEEKKAKNEKSLSETRVFEKFNRMKNELNSRSRLLFDRLAIQDVLYNPANEMCYVFSDIDDIQPLSPEKEEPASRYRFFPGGPENNQGRDAKQDSRSTEGELDAKSIVFPQNK